VRIESPSDASFDKAAGSLIENLRENLRESFAA
jgi:hypothetical protein